MYGGEIHTCYSAKRFLLGITMLPGKENTRSNLLLAAGGTANSQTLTWQVRKAVGTAHGEPASRIFSKILKNIDILHQHFKDSRYPQL